MGEGALGGFRLVATELHCEDALVALLTSGKLPPINHQKQLLFHHMLKQLQKLILYHLLRTSLFLIHILLHFTPQTIECFASAPCKYTRCQFSRMRWLEGDTWEM